MKHLLVLGAGGHGRSVAETALATGRYQVVGFLDDGADVGSLVMGLPVKGRVSELSHWLSRVDSIIVAIGHNLTRAQLTDAVPEDSLATIVHPTSIVAPSARIGAGSAIMAGAIIGTSATIGRGVIVNLGAVVDHDGAVLDFGHLGVNASMAGASRLGRAAWLQCGACLGSGVCVPDGAVVPPGRGLSDWVA